MTGNQKELDYWKNICYVDEAKERLDEVIYHTLPTDVAVKKYKDACREFLDERLINLRWSDINFEYNAPVQDKLVDYVSHDMDKMNVMKKFRVHYIVGLVFPCYVKDNKNDELIKKLDETLNAVGYDISDDSIVDPDLFIQPFVVDSKKDDHLTIEVHVLQLEVMYSNFVPNINTTLYHVVPDRYIESIVKYGLVPRSSSSDYEYESRVYLFTTHNMEVVYKYGVDKVNSLIERLKDRRDKCNSKDNGFYVLRIDGDNILNSTEYKKEQLKFFVDPKYTSGMYVENTYMAVFTYNNIPRRLIENSAEYCTVEGERVVNVEQVDITSRR